MSTAPPPPPLAPGQAVHDGPPPSPPTDRWRVGRLDLLTPQTAATTMMIVIVGLVVLPDAFPSLGVSALLAVVPAAVLIAAPRSRAAVTSAVGGLAAVALLGVTGDPLTGAALVLAAGAAWAMTLAGSISRDPSDVGPGTLLSAAVTWSVDALAVPRDVGGAVLGARRRADRTERGWTVAPVVRGVLMAVPVLVVVLALLSSDVVFSSLLRGLAPDGLRIPDQLVGRIVLTAVLAMATLGTVRTLRRTNPLDELAIAPFVGRTDVVTALSLLSAVLWVFVAMRAVAAAGGADHILATEGLTYAQYARAGFFQLVGVTAVSTSALGVAVAVVVREDGRIPRVVRDVGTALIVAVTTVAAIALHGLLQYVGVFGLTRLRVWPSIATIWIIGVGVLILARLWGAGRGRRWMLPASTAWGVALVLLVGVLRPDAVIARVDVGRAISGAQPLDVRYVADLSDDAVPVLVDAVRGGRLEPTVEDGLREALCARDRTPVPLLDQTVSSRRADAALSGLCGS